MKGKRRIRAAAAATLCSALIACSARPAAPKIAGLYLGMPLAQAMRRAEEICRRADGGRFRRPQWRQWDSFSVHTDRLPAGDITLRNGAAGVNYICIGPGLVDAIYGSAAISAEQLARRLADEQRLPPLRRGTDTNPPQPVPYWEYVSPDGWKIFIKGEKYLVLENWRRAEDER